MLKPITIGNHIHIQEPVFLAPMSGVSDTPFRREVKRHGAALVVSEMIASQSIIKAHHLTIKRTERSENDFPMAVQIAGCDPALMAEAARINEDLGADIIDINFGCPAKKIVNSYAGSAMMRDMDTALKILESVVKSVNIPVTLKMRTGWDQQSRNAPEMAKHAENIGIQMLTVHGRTRCDFYRGKSDWGFIQQVKNAVNIPVIANGDITDIDSAKTALWESGADGIMIGRATYGKPWLVQQITDQLMGRTPKTIDLQELFTVIQRHFDDILQHYGAQHGIRIARKHLGWYSKGLFDSAQFRSKINRMSDEQEIRTYLHDYFTEAIAYHTKKQNEQHEQQSELSDKLSNEPLNELQTEANNQAA
jgi:tRNA-dihydrouridine synthase B